MTRDRGGTARLGLARFGLPDSEAIRADLHLAGLLPTGSDSAAEDRPVLQALGRSGNPPLAARLLGALIAGAGADEAAALRDGLRTDPAFRARLIGLLGASEPLGEHVVAHPESCRRIATAEPFADWTAPARFADALAAVIHDERGARLPAHRAPDRLRDEYRHQLAAIAAADLAAAIDPDLPAPDVAAVSRALAALADGVLTTALQLAEPAAAPQAPMAVIAMGKCGGRELNYLSDVDVLFVVGDESDPAALRTATTWASELMQICARVAWEVDAALRPEGKAGPLVRTLTGYRAYYEKWAKTWEFQALLKARPVAGDAALGEAFVAMTGPLVWSAANRPDFVADVQAMRRRVDASVPIASRDTELKLSSGGLRDVEFAVQLLQLVHGRLDESLRVAGTLDALEALTAGGYVGREDGADLAAAYAFERRIEHRAQLMHLRRTHSLPAADADRRWLARTEGMTGGDGHDDPALQLTDALARCGATIRRLHEKLFYRPLLDAVAAVPTDELRLTPEAAASRLAALGFAAPGPALRHIAALTEGVSRRAAIQRTLLPVLLGTFADAPDPDAGLLGYRTVSDALAETPWYLRLLRDEGFVAQRLARLLGTSRLIAELLQRAPEILKALADDDELAGRDPAALAATAATALAARAERAQTAEGAAAAARSARRHEMLRLACADVLGLTEVRTVMAGLTSIADATVRAALAAAHRQVHADGGGLAQVAVIAMGRLGGQEMGYSSDADVLFVAAPLIDEADPRAVTAEALRIAETTTKLLGRPSPDPALVIDADLRPEGKAGALVRTVDSYRQYWQRQLEPWQRQALLRARPLAGDDALSREFMAVIDELRYPADGLPLTDVREIRRIKARVDTERMPRRADRALHTKLGPGGLADVEWTVQLLQLRHAAAVPGLRTTGTLTAVEAAAAAGLIGDDDAAALAEGWTAAVRARNAIMLVTGRAGDEIPAHGPVLAGIARACGYPADADPGEFVDEYRRATRHARRAVELLFDEG